ncbi:MAG: cell division protein FtsX [Minisyncoccia bacterium]
MFLLKIINQGIDLFYRKKTITIVNVFMIFLMSLFLFSGIFGYYIINETINSVKERLDFSIYFKTDTPKEDIDRLKNILENFPKVKEVKYVTKDIALEKFKKEAIANPVIGEALKELNINPLVDYLIVKSDDPEVYNEIAKYIEQSPYRATIEFLTYYENQKAIQRFISLSNYAKILITMLLIIISAFTFLIIFNLTILSIYSQKDDIEIYRLIGAPNYYIALPFGVFNIISAFLGFIFSEGCVVLILIKTENFWNKIVPSLNPGLFFYQNFFIINLSIFSFILIISIISTCIAIQKYLKI